jgi:uncharacterized protein YndB with AHSA1/START domain
MYALSQAPVAKVVAFIRRPPHDIFNAFVEPATLTKFWLAAASAPLELGKTVHWEFLVEGASADAAVKVLDAPTRIVIDWSDGTNVEWTFTERMGQGTVVVVTQSGFAGSGDEIVAQALDATGGFSLVLSDLKALLEQGNVVNLVRDKATLIEDERTRGAVPLSSS